MCSFSAQPPSPTSLHTEKQGRDATEGRAEGSFVLMREEESAGQIGEDPQISSPSMAYDRCEHPRPRATRLLPPRKDPAFRGPVLSDTPQVTAAEGKAFKII